MARKTKTFQIQKSEKDVINVTVNELTVRQIIDLMQDDGLLPSGGDIKTLVTVLDEKVLPICINLKSDELIEMAPSDLSVIWENFKEVNKAFFDKARQMGMTSFLETLGERIKVSMLEDFSKLLAGSSVQDTLKH